MAWMRRQIAAALSLAILVSVTASALAIAQAASTNSGKGSQVHSTIKDLMDSIIDPSSDVIWGASGTIVDKDQGTVELFPKTQDEWMNVRRAAVRIIEGSNLLMTPGRQTAPAGTKSETPGVELEPTEIDVLIDRNRPGFNSFATALRDLGWEALRASEAKNTESLLEIGGRMQEVCEGCHQTFWYPNASVPYGGGR
jgi:hypothetical protein